MTSYSIQKNQQGFTLLELMIALSIFAVMGMAAYRLLSGETRLQTELEQHSQQLQHWQRGMRRLTDDLHQLAPRSIRLEYGDREAALLGSSDSIHFTRYGWSNPLYKTRSQLQRVEFHLTGNEDQALQRVSWPVLDRAPDSEALSQTLLPGVTDVRWRYMDKDKQWHTQWPTTQGSASGSNDSQAENELPLAIEVTLSSDQLGEVNRLIVLRSFSEKDANNTSGQGSGGTG